MQLKIFFECSRSKYHIKFFNKLQTINASHNVYVRIKENKVEFVFKNINLAAAAGNPPVGGHGDVLFKIKTNSNLTQGTTVYKMSQIYFDYNFPIDTGTAQTTFQTLNNPIFEKDNTIKVYPNPANNNITINKELCLKTNKT